MALVIAAVTAHGIVGTTSSTPGNFPAADTTYKWVGRALVGAGFTPNASVVAVGPHTLLTATHVNPTAVLIDGVQYNVVSKTTAPGTDLQVLQIQGSLPGWYTLGTAAPLGTGITMVGYGQSGVVNAAGTGYSVGGGSGTRRAGNNFVEDTATLSGIGPSLISYLDGPGDASLAPLDSGGGWFANGKLVGISSFTFNLTQASNGSKTYADYGFPNANTAGYVGGGNNLPAGTHYFGSGAIDLTDRNLAAFVHAQAVPEPGTIAALGLGLLAIAGRRKSRR